MRQFLHRGHCDAMQISQHVRVRGSPWRIVDIRAYEDCQLVTLAGISPLQGSVERPVLAPFDDIEPVAHNQRARFRRAGAWWHTCRVLIGEHAPPASLHAIHRAAIDVMAHQLEPALALIRGLGSRVLLADEVGLGKTIQAGIIVSELRTRGVADRTLVLTPAGLRDQWVEELSMRFGLDAQVADAPGLRRLSAMLPIGVNPWITARIAVASVDYVKRPDVLPAVLACAWDIVIVDEAHGAAGDSERQAAVAMLAARAAYVLLLTATPHSGDARTFAALCRTGAAGDDLIVFRRRRIDVRSGAIRKIHEVHVRSSPAELRLHASLERYVAAVHAEQEGLWLTASVLHKRALSSAWSLARSVERRLEALSNADSVSAQQLGLPLGDPDGESSAADEEPGWPAGLGLSDRSREASMLRSLLAAARMASARESKVVALVRLLRRSREPAIVFTEYRDTLLHIRSALRRPVAVLHGGMTRMERATAVADFVSGRRSVLLATDAGGEGLNLHRTCRLVVNLELPWNPMRLEQRIGRVDRIGQRRTVHAFHLIAAGTAEQRILARLKARIARASADIGVSDPLGPPGHDEERAVAHLVVLGMEEQAPCTPPRDEAVRRVTPDLRDEAAQEARRLTFARLLMRPPAGAAREASAEEGKEDTAEGQRLRRSTITPPHGDDAQRPWICRAHRAALRAALGRRVLTLWRVRCEDGCGRTLEWALLPLIVELTDVPSRWTGHAIDDLRQQIEIVLAADTRGRPSGTVAAFIASWRTAASHSAQSFLSARLVRERAIQAQAALPLTAPIQGGLFDRRAERAQLAAAAARAEADADRRSRITWLQRAATISMKSPELLLVLVP
jgi:superfamily II DNA or RNA helicase